MTKPKNNPSPQNQGEGPHKEEKSQTTKHSDTYQKKHEKGHFPRKIWPTDSENKKDKGQKI